MWVTIYINGCATYKADKIHIADYTSIRTNKPTLHINPSYIRLSDSKTKVNDDDAKKKKLEIEAELISEIEKIANKGFAAYAKKTDPEKKASPRRG